MPERRIIIYTKVWVGRVICDSCRSGAVSKVYDLEINGFSGRQLGRMQLCLDCLESFQKELKDVRPLHI